MGTPIWLNLFLLCFKLSGEADESGHRALLDFSHQMLTKNKGCLERIACTSSQHIRDVNSLRSLKLIMRNNLLSSILNTTALEDASNYGLQGKDCQKYGPCMLAEDNFLKLMTDLVYT